MDIERSASLALQRASFVGTLAFGRQVLWMLFMASAGAWFFLGAVEGQRALFWVLLATALAYGAQLLVTLGKAVAGLWLQLASIACAGMAFLALLLLVPLGA